VSSTLPHRFGPYGGQYVPELLMPALTELEQAWLEAIADAGFKARLTSLLNDYVGRPSPLYLAERLSAQAGHPIYLKREDLNHTGAHKINNALGQALLAQRMGKTRIIAETGAGQHGVASATACALLDLECIVYMALRTSAASARTCNAWSCSARPCRRRRRRPHAQGGGLSGDPRLGHQRRRHPLHHRLGCRPAPYPVIVRDLQRIIGDEARAQILEKAGRTERVIACVGGGSNSIGIFIPFVNDAEVKLIGVEAAGEGIETGRHGAPLTVAGPAGVLHGSYSAIMQDEDGQILEAHSISAGLDYPGSGPSTPGCETRAAPAITRSPTSSTRRIRADRALGGDHSRA